MINLKEKHKDRLIKLGEEFNIDLFTCCELKRVKKNIEVKFKCPYTDKIIVRRLGNMEKLSKCKKCKLKDLPCLTKKSKIIIEEPIIEKIIIDEPIIDEPVVETVEPVVHNNSIFKKIINFIKNKFNELFRNN